MAVHGGEICHWKLRADGKVAPISAIRAATIRSLKSIPDGGGLSSPLELLIGFLPRGKVRLTLSPGGPGLPRAASEREA
jgi:hypothetical protein